MLNDGRWSVRELGAGRESAMKQVCSQVTRAWDALLEGLV